MSDRPSDDGGRSRSDAASRLAALLADDADQIAIPADAPPAGGGAPRERPAVVAPDLDLDLDLDLDQGRGPAPDGPSAVDLAEGVDAIWVVAPARPAPRQVASPPERPAAEPRPAAPAGPVAPADDDVLADLVAPPAVASPDVAPPDGVPEDGDVLAEPGEPPPAAGVTAAPPGRPSLTLRAVAFATALAVLVVAVPALGWIGGDRLLGSRGGDIVPGAKRSDEPGYRALVEPTDVALVIHHGADGELASIALLALGAGDAGGTVLLVPLHTATYRPQYLADRLKTAWVFGGDEALTSQIEARLGMAIPQVISVDDAALAALVEPVAPLAFENPDSVTLAGGREVPVGPVSLAAVEVGPFLSAGGDDESELSRLARHELLWQAWLGAIRDASTEDSVDAATTGIGPFLRILSAGEVQVETLSVELPRQTDELDPPLHPAEGFAEQIIAAVPYPRAPASGWRWTVKLLNGAEGAALPRSLLHNLILAGGSVTTVGNADRFGREDTLIEYAGADWEDAATTAHFVLGGDVTVRAMEPERAEAEGADLVITIGRSSLERFAGG